MNLRNQLTPVLIATLLLSLCGAPQFAQAWAQEPAAPQPAASQDQQQPAQQPPNSGQQPSTVPAEAQPLPPATTPDATQEPAVQQPGTQQPVTQQPGAQQPGATVDPSQGPLAPVPSQQLPEAPSATPQTQPAGQQPAPTPGARQTQREPLGAATAEGIKTAGGGASRPAGSAIAPAKQRQVRSFLIKLSLIAAAGAAIGTVYALSKGTPSTPPNTR